MRRIQPASTAVAGHLDALRRWLLPAALIAFAGLLAALGDPARELLRYDREALAAGEAWRLVGGHLVHLGWMHYLLNAAGLVLVWLLVGERLGAGAWLAVLLAVVAGIDAGFWLLRPDLHWYVGLSGVLHGLLCAGLVAGARGAAVESAAIGALLLAKLVYEQLYGALPGTGSTAGGPVIVDAHLYGAVAGLLAGSALSIRGRGAVGL